MITTTLAPPVSPRHFTHHAEAKELALRLAHAEHSLQMLTLGQVDAITDPSGRTYLLRPAQEQLRENGKQLQILIDSIPDVITVVDHAGTILSKNLAVNRLLGYEREDLLGTKFFDLVHEDDWPAVHAAFFNVVEGLKETSTALFRHLASDGSYCMVTATVGKMRDASENIIFSARPLSSNPWVRQKSVPPPVVPPVVVEPVSFARDRFLAMLSHELRTPLMPILLSIFELQDDERFAEARPALAMIRRNVEVQSRLLEELTDFTTVGQHKVRLQLESIDAHEHVRFVLEICQSDIAAAQIEVLVALHASDKMVWADSVRFQQVLWNLVKNAVKFSTPGSTIAVTSANVTPGSITLQVADNGIGIEPALLPQIFDSFRQGDQQLYGGLGLGMYIAKGLAEAQGGTLAVESQGRGQGTTFRLTLKTVAGREVDPGSFEKSTVVLNLTKPDHVAKRSKII